MSPDRGTPRTGDETTVDTTTDAEPGSVEQIEHDIEQTRDQLADTVEALAYKADVPARARERATAVKESAAEKATVVRHRASETATHAAHVARERADQAANVAREQADHAAHVARRRADQAVHTAQEAPPRKRAAGVAAALAAVGAVWLIVRRRRS
jgi:cobalamin biosynthesis Mg chelatase CobN